MKTALLIAVPGGALFTAFAWRISELLSPDAIGMALGLAFGVLAGLPAAALVIVASSRRAPYYGDDYEPPTIDAHPTTCAEDVTPYTHLFRRAVNLQPLLPRQNPDEVLRTYQAQMEAPADTHAQIAELEAYLDHLKGLSNPQRDPRQFVVRWEGETR